MTPSEPQWAPVWLSVTRCLIYLVQFIKHLVINSLHLHHRQSGAEARGLSIGLFYVKLQNISWEFWRNF